VLDDGGASEVAGDEPRRLVQLPVRQRRPQRIDLDEDRAVVVGDIPTSERGLAGGRSTVDQDEAGDLGIFADSQRDSGQRDRACRSEPPDDRRRM
jgi:hypothetical protein